MAHGRAGWLWFGPKSPGRLKFLFQGASMEFFGTKGICDWLLENFRVEFKVRYGSEAEYMCA